mmetsp:Transcript_50300/g.97113  ORF Transcript_50300/g.97113 Transcript_50300/m.97113 type:complete len:96 (+) Transcript_50300:351-638(+)
MPCPSCEHVSNIHDKGIWHRAAVDPSFVSCIQDLESANFVLLQDREEAIVRVLPYTNLGMEISDWPVMQEAVCGHGLCQELVKEIHRFVQNACHV